MKKTVKNRFKSIAADLLWELEYDIWRPLRASVLSVRRRLSKPYRSFLKTALRQEPWDWYYMLDMERASLTYMRSYLQKEGHHENAATDIRRITICIRLLDIVLETEPVGARVINFRNINRFIFSKDAVDVYLARQSERYARDEYYIKKAFTLYNKIRTEFMFSWWD